MHFSHIGTRLEVTGGKQSATRYLMTAAGLFCFNAITSGDVSGFGTMQPCVSRGGFGRLPGYRSDQPGSAPKLDIVAFQKNQGPRDRFFVVGAGKRLVSVEVTVIARSVSAITTRLPTRSHASPSKG
jgi:hypothetical protein